MDPCGGHGDRLLADERAEDASAGRDAGPAVGGRQRGGAGADAAELPGRRRR